MLRWAAPGRRVYLQVLTALAASLLRLAAAAGRLMMEIAQAATLTDPTTLMILGHTSWVGWQPWQTLGHSASQTLDRPKSDGSGWR